MPARSECKVGAKRVDLGTLGQRDKAGYRYDFPFLN